MARSGLRVRRVADEVVDGARCKKDGARCNRGCNIDGGARCNRVVDGARGVRNKFGALMFEPDVFRKHMYRINESICDIVGTFRRPPVIRRAGIMPPCPCLWLCLNWRFAEPENVRLPAEDEAKLIKHENQADRYFDSESYLALCYFL